MTRNLYTFITDLQKRDEATKKNWLIGSTAVSMVIVLVLWGFYFSSTLQDLTGTQTAQDTGGFGATFSQGLRVLSDKIGSQISQTMENVQKYMSKTNSVTIQPAAITLSNNVDQINPQKFP